MAGIVQEDDEVATEDEQCNAEPPEWTPVPNGESGGVGAAAAAPQPSSPRRRSMVPEPQHKHLCR